MFELNKHKNQISATFTGRLTAKSVLEWSLTARDSAGEVSPGFTVLIDLTNVDSMEPEAASVMLETQSNAQLLGVGRSIVVFRSSIIRLQYERISNATGINSTERYLSADKTPNWRDVAEAWLQEGIEPAAYPRS